MVYYLFYVCTTKAGLKEPSKTYKRCTIRMYFNVQNVGLLLDDECMQKKEQITNYVKKRKNGWTDECGWELKIILIKLTVHSVCVVQM